MSSAVATWVLSPHSDDAALSTAVAIRSGALAGPIGVVTAFSVSNFAVPAGADTATVTALRAAEDAAFASAFDVEHVALGLEDGPIRLNATTTEVFDLNRPVTAADVAAITTALEAMEVDWSSVTLLVPSGLGGHIDHRIAAEVGAEFPAREVLAYADQPYVLHDPRRLDSLLELRGAPEWSAAATPENVAIKTEAASFYASQPPATRVITRLAEADPSTIVEALWRIRSR